MMNVTGFSGLLASNTTREFKTESGVVLKARKFRGKDYAQLEDEVVRKRASLSNATKVVESALKESDNEEIKRALIEAYKEGVNNVITRPQCSLASEMSDFMTSMYGRVFMLYVVCRDNSDYKLIDDYMLIYNSLSVQDVKNVNELFDWAQEIDYLGNFDSLSVEATPVDTCDGDH